MNILFLSMFGDGYGLAWQLAQEGHSVAIHIKAEHYKPIGQGFKNPKRINDPTVFVPKSDLIIFDMTGQGAYASKLIEQGRPVYGGSLIADRLEDDRQFAQQVMKKYTKASIPDYRAFNNIEQGIKFLEKADPLYCFKPDHAPTCWTFVPRENADNETVINMMRRFGKANNEFILQERISGIEISTEGFFNCKDWIPPFNHTMEKKRFLEGEHGPNCGCMGQLIWIAKKNDRLVKEMLLPLTSFLQHHKYVGSIDVNFRVWEDKAWFLEFTPRPGWDSTQGALALVKDKAEYLHGIATKEIDKGDYLPEQYSVGVRLSLSPYPYAEDHWEVCKKTKGIKAVDVPGYLNHAWWPFDVCEQDGEMVQGGVTNLVGTAVMTGDSIQECREDVYDMVDEIALTDDIQYRRDIAADCKGKIEKLEEWGWL